MQTTLARKSQSKARPAAPSRNHASVRNVLRGPTVQAQLKIGAANDPAEREADAVADKVMRMPAPGAKEELIQPKERPGTGPGLSASTESAIRGLGSGAPMPASERAFFESRFGRGFSGVRIHSNAAADTSARSINARAFTLGSDIVFASGEYAPGSASGRRLLAHELTHAVQQNGKGRKVQRYSTQDCSESDIRKIAAAMERAKSMLAHALIRLTTSPVNADTKRQFANHFGTWAEWRRDVVVLHLRRDLRLLDDQDLQFECETDSDRRAYTYWIFGDVHLAPNWLNDSDLTEQAETLIHEIHHWDPLRGHLDLGYHENTRDADTIWVVAVNNADAYSELVQDLF